MDILNWLYLAKNKLVRSTVSSTKDLLVFGSKVGFSKRGDLYQTYGMPVEDFITLVGTGPAGPQGIQGIQGVQGVQGIQGVPVALTTISKAYVNGTYIATS